VYIFEIKMLKPWKVFKTW